MSANPKALLTELRHRLERGTPQGYWEENLADGRRAAVRQLLRWMDPLAGRRVLDAACGLGAIARTIASRGATVTGCGLEGPAAHDEGEPQASAIDLRPEPATMVLSEPVLGEPVLGEPGPRWDDVVLWEVFEDLALRERLALLSALESHAASRLFVAVRLESSWNRWLNIPGHLLPAGDPVLISRSLHLETHYRLKRQETVTRRNSAIRLLEFGRPAGPLPGD